MTFETELFAHFEKVGEPEIDPTNDILVKHDLCNRSHDDDELLHLARVNPDLEELQIGERK